MSFTGLYLRFI